MATKKTELSPAIPIPLVFDVQKRIQQLRSYLDPNHPWEHPWHHPEQNVNIEAVIKLYEEKKIDGIQLVYIIDGKVITEEEAKNRPSKVWVWCEGRHYQYAQKHTYGHGPFGLHFHELRMSLRLMPHQGGDGTVYGIIVMNDTGSDILSLFHSDMQYLGNIQGYSGWQGETEITCANGTTNIYPRIEVEVQLVRDDNTPWSDWFPEDAIVRPDGPGLSRLSGYGIRDALYMGTSPGNHSLAVTTTKGGLASLL